MARIACVYSVENYHTVEQPLPRWIDFPFGLSMIAAVLEKAGHQVSCWVICPATPLDQVSQQIISQFGADMVALTAVSTQFPIIDRLAGVLKAQAPGLPTLLGGHHATLASDDAIASPWIDALCVGEGEAAAIAYAAAIDAGQHPSAIPGLWIKGPNGIEKNPTIPFNEDLDRLPFVNRDHWARWVSNLDNSYVVVIGRGCPYVCTYCSNHALKDVSTGKFVRFRSAANVLEEIRQLLAKAPDTDFIYLEVETIGAMMKNALELCDHLAQFNASLPHPLQFGTNLSVTSRLVQNESQMRQLLAGFQRAGITRLNVGLESGSERMRGEILRRPVYTNQELIRFCQLAKEYDVHVQLFVLIGLPTETVADYLQTIAIARQCDPYAVYPSIFYPYPGTHLFKLAAELGLFDPASISPEAERSRAFLDLPGFPKWRIFLEFVIFHARLFHGRWPRSVILAHMVRQFLTAFPGLLSAFHRVVRRYPLIRRLRDGLRRSGQGAVTD